MSQDPSETHWIERLKAGDSDAARDLWDRYFQRLLGLARKKLSSSSRRVADEEDVAVSAFNSFCKGAVAGRFAKLQDRDDLWQILAMIVSRKAGRQIQRERAEKRGGAEVRGESAFLVSGAGSEIAGLQQTADDGPSPELAAMIDEQFERLLDRLDDQTLREVALWKLEGYTNAEIADKLGRNVRSVERKLHLIRKHWSQE